MQNPQGFSQWRGGCALLLPLVVGGWQSTNWSRSNPAWSCSTLKYSPQPSAAAPRPAVPAPPPQPLPLATKWRPRAAGPGHCASAAAAPPRGTPGVVVREGATGRREGPPRSGAGGGARPPGRRDGLKERGAVPCCHTQRCEFCAA